MPTSSYMPDVTVAVALNSGYLTPAASRTYTDISSYVELAYNITINVGRGDERSTADANTCVFTLDNRDGRFTAGKTSGPYGSDWRLGRPIRVQADPVDGAIQTEFVGFIDEISVNWEDTEGYSYVTVTCTSRLSRVGQQAVLKSLVETTILADSPIAYYTMGEGEGATRANDSSGAGRDPLVALGDPAIPVVFGSATGPPTDGLTAAQFAGGQYLRGGAFTPSTTSLTYEVAFNIASPPGTETDLMAIPQLLPGSVTRSVAMSTAGLVKIGGTLVTSTASYADGAWHHLAVTIAAANLELFVDGVSMGTGVWGGGSLSTSSIYEIVVGGTAGFSTMTGAFAHAAVTQSVLSGARIAEHAAAQQTGFAGETTSARLIRYAAYAGIASSEISAETGQTTVAHVDTTGKQVLELMRLMETSEGGFLYDERDGSTTFHNRAHRLTAAAIYTLDMAQQHVESDYAPKLDRSGLVNDVSAANVAGTYSAHVFDTASQTENGYAATSIETASDDDDEPSYQANWALLKYKDPKVRVASLSVQALAQVGKTPNCSAVMATDPGDKITVSNHPSQAANSSTSYFVEGYTKVYGPESLLITFNLSPTSPEDTTFVLGDSTRGVLGTNPLAL